MSFKNVGKIWSPKSLEADLAKIAPPKWAKYVVFHHTYYPDLKIRPNGFTVQHIRNIQYGYQKKDWSSGPAYFIDENEIFGMTPPTEFQIHCPLFNHNSVSMEVLGNYDKEDPFTGRGLSCWKTAAKTGLILLKWLKLPIKESSIKFHNDDPDTDKTCPGTKIKKDWVFNLIKEGEPIKEPKIEAVKMVVVSDYMKVQKKYTDSDVETLLKKKGNMFFWGKEWLEGAYYDSKKGSTVAPLSELETIPSKV